MLNIVTPLVSIKAISYNRVTALLNLTKNKMALNLNIPLLQDNPLFLAEIRPQRINQSLGELNETDPINIALHLHSELEILNRQKVSPSNRLQALDCYRPWIMSTALALAEDYCNTALPLHDKSKLAASTAESLWLELGYGYKLALVDLQNQLIKIGTDKISAYAIQRAMHAIAENALVYYQTYVTPPEHIWGDLHQLYFCAAQLGIQNISIKNTNVTTNSTASQPLITTIENTYKHSLLISLAEPQHCSQNDIRLIDEYLAHHINHTQITAVMPLETETGAFIINLDSNSPPVPYNKKTAEPDPDTDILLQTMDLIHSIHQDLRQLQKQQLPKNGSIPADANRDDYIELLTYLIKNWGITPKRIFSRSLKNSDIELVVGIAAIHHVTNENPMAVSATNKQLLSKLNTSEPTPSRWKTLNISATGLLLRRPHFAEKNIRVGGLIGVKAKNEPHWSIGVVRWANCGTRERLDIGVELIAPSAQGVIANFNDLNRKELVLLLSEIPAVKQATTIIAPIGTYAPARQLTLSYKNGTKQVMLTKLVERSHYFERMQYSVVS